MRRGAAAGLVALSLLAGCGGDGRPSTASTASTLKAAAGTDDILRGFRDYKAAILAGKGTVAVGHLTQATVDYYGDLLKAAVGAPRGELDRMHVFDILTVLLARYQYTGDELRTLTGRTFLVRAIDDKLIGEQSVASLDYDTAERKGDTARLRHADGSGGSVTMEMRIEGGAWKVDLTSVIQALSPQFDREAERQGKPRSTVALGLIKAARSDATERLLDPPT